MSKKIKILALTLACVVTLGAGMITAFASAKTTVTVEDSFNDISNEGTVDSNKWASIFADPANPSIKQSGSENPSLQFVVNESGGEQVQYGTVRKAQGIESVSFSLKMADAIKGTAKWFAVNFVPALELNKVKGSNHYYSPIMIDPKTIYVKGSGSSQSSVSWSTLFPELIEESGTICETWVSFKLVPTSATTMDVYVTLREDDGSMVFPETPVLTINGTREDAKEHLVSYGIEEDIDFQNSYVLFGSEGMGHGSHIDDIKVVATSGNIGEDFTSAIRSEDFQTFPDGKLGSALKVTDNNTLQISNAKAGDRVITHAKINEETSIAEGIIVFEASFRIKMAKNCTDEVAFVFGLDGETADLRQGSYAYVIGKDYGRVVKYADGSAVYDSDKENALIQVASKKGADINIKVYKDGSVEVYEDGKFKASLPEADRYHGNVGFAVLSDTTGTVDIDNIVIKQTSYYVPVTKSVTHNFSNSFFGNEGFEDFALSPSGTGGVYVKDGKLQFDHCADSDFFGSAHQYDSFIMDYQLCSINVGEGKTAEQRWLGLDVGKASKSTSHYGSNVLLAVVIVPESGVNTVGLWKYHSDNSKTDPDSIKITNVKGIPVDYFKNIQYDNKSKMESDIKAGDAVCFRWVSDATNENLKLYMKRASESEYTLYAEVNGVNTSGYQAITCTGWTTLTIDNFSMSNTSPIYEIADNEPPKEIEVTKTEIIYTKPDVDVNWEEELRLNGEVKVDSASNQANHAGQKFDATNGDERGAGCTGAVTGGAGLAVLALIGSCVIRRKEH